VTRRGKRLPVHGPAKPRQYRIAINLSEDVVRRLHQYFTAADPGECWPWRGATNQRGYGNFMLTDGATAKSHRVTYELLVGPIPEGLELDHTCRNTGCVNPAHLEPVTHAENIRRGYAHRKMMRAAA
jgi:hypothetical protein